MTATAPASAALVCISYAVSGGELAATYRNGVVSYRLNGAPIPAHLARRKLGR